MKKVIFFLFISILTLFLCLGVHLSLLQVKDSSYEVKKGDLSALADVNIDAVFNRDSGDGRSVIFHLHKGNSTNKIVRNQKVIPEEQEEKSDLLSYERQFLMDDAARKPYPTFSETQLIEDGYIEKRPVDEADAQYKFYNVGGKEPIKVSTQHVVANDKFQLKEVMTYTEEKKVEGSYIEFTPKHEADGQILEYADVLPMESIRQGKGNYFYFMPETNSQFHGENAIYRIRYEEYDKNPLNNESQMQIKKVEPITKLTKTRSYYKMVLVNTHLLVISYDAKGNTYATLYDENGKFIKEIMTKDKLLMEEGSWQNNGYFHLYNNRALYRLDTHTMQLSKVATFTPQQASAEQIDDVYYYNGKTYILSVDEEKVKVHVYQNGKLIHDGIWHLGAYEKETDVKYRFFDAKFRR